MSRLLLHSLFLTVWFVHLDGRIRLDRPTITTSNGDLVLEPAFDKNIYLRSNGPKSSVFVGDINLLGLNVTAASSQYVPSSKDDLDNYLNGPNGILRRLERLESRNSELPSDLLFNITTLSRKINRQTRLLMNLQTRINERARDECQSRPCSNGGTCLNLANGYYCLCPPNWEGQNCDIDVNECRNFAGTDLGCQNAGTCINRPGTYECLCRSGWFGLHCTRKAKDCSGGDFEMCGHGTCIPVTTGEGIKCICDQGWTTNGTGDACLTDVDECNSSQGPRCSVNPRVDCINLPGSFRCGQCPPGFEGDGYICSDIDECMTTLNGGCSTSPMVTCHNTIGSRICGSCPPGYQGDGMTCSWRGSCSINRGGCHPSAQCIDNPALGGQIAQCVCPVGMDGDGIGLHGCYIRTDGNNTRGCESNPCGVHGQCHPLRTGYTCICTRGFSGAQCDVSSDYCAGSPCLNGGSCRPDDRTLRGFRCECTAQFTGDLCHVASRNCGGLLHAEEGNIVYPLTNTSYNHNSRCAWVIQTDADKVINVTFTKFNLESSPECQYDFLQIHDGQSSSSQILGRFCGNSYPKGGNIISSHNHLYFWFRSDQTVAKDGFALHWTSISPICGGEVDATVHGHINSPGSPGKYPPNRDCYWHLTTTFGKRIQLHFFSLDIESHSNCSFDYIAIYDGAHTSDPLLDRYCNSTQPAPVQSAGSEIFIHFHSDAYGSGYGFQITFAQTEGVPGCGGFFTEERGEIASPSYEGRYLSSLVCEYKIRTSPNTKIKIKFKSFKLEKSIGCRFDNIKIYDGPSSDSRLIGRFCGVTFPTSIISTSNTLYIKFYSDSTLESEGFRINYESICHQILLGDSGVIKSPGYPHNYPENRVCEYLIGTVPGKAIQLTFYDFDVEDNRYYSCQYDNVEIRDGVDANATLLGRYCGGISHIPPVTISAHNYMYVRFKSDVSITGTGFYANYTTVATACGGIYRETVGLINFPSDDKDTYANDQSCSWIMLAPEGTHIKLVWNRFDLEAMRDCGSDYVQLVEIDDDNEVNTLGKYCGTALPPVITSNMNRLMINFVSDSSIRSTGFSVSYTFLDAKLHCGGTYFKSHGYIYSPGWPNRYESSRDCVWKIIAPVGQQIKLTIVQFDLERPIRNTCNNGDYLEIRNGQSETAPIIGKYCGNFESKRIVSFGNKLYLRFVSDSYITGNGFKIEWDSTITGCGGILTSANGSISSPNYPEHYNENAECFYKIVISAGSRIHISFRDLELELTTNCRDDYVEIFDGLNENSPSLGKYCSMSSNLYNIETSTNNAFIKFRSDFYLGAKGFLLEYYTVCHNNLTGLHGVIESPGYPNSYPLNLNCLWTINVPEGNKINITFTHFNLLKQYYRSRQHYATRFGSRMSSRPSGYGFVYQECGSDYLQMKDTSDINFEAKLCGNSLPSKSSSKTNSFQIRFVTGDFYPYSGFRIEWVRYGCGGLIQKRYGSLSINKSLTSSGEELECEWLIESPTGTSITITVSDLYMVDSANCTIDALEFYNGQSVSTPLLTKVCHRGLTRIQATTNYMLVRFLKKSILKDVFFNSVFDSYKSGCGGRIEARSGMIHSQNYPKNYDNNLDCIWILGVPLNHRIELNFIDFDLYSEEYNDDERDCGDHIKIYEGYSTFDANYTQRICPNSNVSQIISKKNVLKLQFITDRYGTAKGFKANFTVTCGAIITAHRDGIIRNDMFVGRSNNNCTWTILAPSLDQKISLTITHMSIPKNGEVITNRKCPSSFLRVYEGDDEKSPLIDEYCGRKVPPMIVSHGSAITVQLGTYSGSVAGQFSAFYSAMSSACGGDLTSEEGTIASPNYPQSYPVSTSCEWTLSTSPGNRVYITFELMDLDYSENCNEDYLEVRENNGAGKILGLYCGSEIPINTTSSRKLYIKFHSDNKDAGRGFLIHYGFLHGNEFMGLDSGQVTSPLYPSNYDGAGDYTWRIVLNDSQTITINVNRFEVPVHGSVCYNYLAIYDGYDADANLLEQFCGIMSSQKILQTSSNVAFIRLKLDETNTGASFHLNWAKKDKNVESTSDKDKVNCGFNDTLIVLPGQATNFSSPSYPSEYENNLNCEWIFSSPSGYHLSLIFDDIELEQTPSCFADFISVYSADNAAQWKPVKEKICLSDFTNQETNSSKYMKVIFQTDVSITRKGFHSKVRSVCGGLITGLSGIVGPTWSDVASSVREIPRRMRTRCDWTIKVRPGRVIKLHFEHFNITNNDNNCNPFAVLRNGDSVEAPLLGSGKYCGHDHENMDEIESSSNAIFVSYVYDFDIQNPNSFQNFKLRYEEKNFECGVTSKLDEDHKWEVFMSPNYPSVPVPYSECVYVFTGPPGEILRVDFLERFDIENSMDCTREFIEIHDGYSDVSRLKGRFCGEKPGTIKSSSNVMYIKYATQLAEPRNGFKANVSIDVCGGTIVANSGELTSPGYPHMPLLPYGSVCEWRIVGTSRLVFNVYAQDIDLPDPLLPCATKVTIEEIMAVNNTVTILKTFCAGEEIYDHYDAVETSTNEVIVKLYFGEPSAWTQYSDSKGFRFVFNSSRPVCGGAVTTSDGYLTTPAYPQETTVRYCQWYITVPDETRRVRLELLDSDAEKHKIGIFNDPNYQTIIQMLPSPDGPVTTQVFESSGNKLALYLWLNIRSSRHRFKARFSSNEEALCGGSLSGSSGELVSPTLDRSYTCEWHYKNENQMITSSNSSEFKTMYLSVKVNSSVTRTRCRFSDARLNLKSMMPTGNAYTFIRNVCGNSEAVYRIPFTIIDFKATKNNFSSLYFHLEWKLQPCGGVIHLGDNPINILNIPNDYNDTLDCAWLLMVSIANRVEIKLEGDFQLQCEDEFVQVSQGIDQYSVVIGDYCKDRTQEHPLVTPFRYMLVQYHSKPKTNTNVKLVARVITNQCGGYLTKYDNVFASPNYPNNYGSNMECTWEIKAGLGYRISLSFIERFVIEDRVNCTKDAVIVYDWKDDVYTEIARVCGRQPPAPLNSTSNQMKVVLRTDGDINLDGFKAMWTPVCGGKFVATEKEAILYSPGYPDQYSSSLDCSYEIMSDKKIIVKFLDFEFEGTYPACEYDNVTLSAHSGYDIFYHVYCGTEMPPTLQKYENVKLAIKSDRYIQRKGFKLSYSQYSCGGRVLEPTVLTSGPTDSYDDLLNCTWSIEAPTNKKVILRFQYIDVESRSDCFADYLAVFNGLSCIDNDKRIALLCGTMNSTTVLRSSGNTMLLQFVTDYSLSYRGFKVEVLFTYSESVGCGGQIDLTPAPYTLKSPLFNGSAVYEKFLNCYWTIRAPVDQVIKIEFIAFHVASCPGVNQTAIGYQNCDCDLIEIRDGINPNSIVIGTYCGHTLPPQLVSSGNIMSIRLETGGGETPSTGFEIRLTLQESPCGKSLVSVSHDKKQLKSPGYDTGSIPRGIYCVYHLDMSSMPYATTQVTIKNLDLQAGFPDPNYCNRDKLTIKRVSSALNTTVGKDYILHSQRDSFYNVGDFDESTIQVPEHYEICGVKQSVDFYLTGSVSLVLQTSPDSDSMTHKGFEIEAFYVGYCGRNYTESQGRIKSTTEYQPSIGKSDCYTLITAPENYTISVYFITVNPVYWSEEVYLDLYDGDKMTSTKLFRINSQFETNIPVFSTGKHVLIHHHFVDDDRITYDMTYVTTNKGRGCGGKMYNLLGKFTSPLYPTIYRQKGSCEWEIETPVKTRVRLHFSMFDLGRSCDQNYVQLVDRQGNTFSTFCAETPADFTSIDNYVKVVFATTMNNGGTGWVAEFVAVL